ncbi:MAG: FAD-binding protein [Eggerthellaceae bacterium]
MLLHADHPFGLHVNADSQVLTAEDEPIPGLFAIGNVQGDFFGKDYPVHCPGVSHGRCDDVRPAGRRSVRQDTTIGELDFA